MSESSSKTPWNGAAPEGRLLRPNEVVRITGLSRSQIYEMISIGRFPPFLKLSARASALPESWLLAFVESKANEVVQKAEGANR